MRCYVICIVALLTLQVSANDFNCYTLIAGSKVTVDGSVMMAHNEDDGGEQMLNWYRVPATSHNQGEYLSFRNGGKEPLPVETNGYLWLELPKMDVSDGYLNDKGVAIASDGCPSKEDREDFTNGGVVYEVRQIVAMQAVSARHAVDIIGYLVEKFGYASSGRTYCVADAKEAWAVAVVQGRHWVAQRIPDHHVMALPNAYTIDKIDLSDRKNFAGSADLIQYATDRGWYNPEKDGEFSFRNAYGSPRSNRHPHNISRAWLPICRLSGKEYPQNSDLPFSFEPSKKITLSDMMGVLSSHYDDTPWEEKKMDIPHDIDGSICHSTTQYGVVFQLRNNMPVEIGSVAWIAPYHPCMQVFIPWYLGINSVPTDHARYDSYAKAIDNHFTDTENFRTNYPNKAYWKYVDFSEEIKKDYAQNIKTIKQGNDKYQKRLFDQQPVFEAKMLELYLKDKKQCMSALTEYTFRCVMKDDFFDSCVSKQQTQSTLTDNNQVFGWKAGVAKLKITPQENVWLAGYAARDRAAEGTSMDLWAKAILLEDASGQQVICVTTDMIGFQKGMSDRIREQLNTRFGWSKAQIILNASHTHSGPVIADPGTFSYFHDNYNNSKDELDKVARYTQWFEKQIIELVIQAVQSLEPVSLSAANGIARVQVNRRNNPENELTPLTELKGPNDYSVPVLKVTNQSGAIKAIIFGYACHPTTLDDYLWSGDFPGYAQIILEKLYPDATALFFQGAGADMNPIPRRSHSLVKQYGIALAASVERTLSEEMQALSPSLTTAYKEILLPFGSHPTEKELNEIIRTQTDYQKRWAEEMLAKIKTGQPLMKTYPYPIQLWNLGGWPLFSMGGELTIGYAIGLKERYGQNVFVMGYSNDVMAYIPTKTVLEEGGYEGATAMMADGLPAPWTNNIEELVYEGIESLAVQAGIPLQSETNEK